ncbi:MAG: hypothetical protein JJU28_18740 [Cyclobacteriaceae bacterium]|nr:hypothetical protein [Cyclobacteriaceae bacterium]
MKNLALTTLLVLIISSSCNQESPLELQNDFSQEIDHLKSMNSTGLNLAVLHLGENISHLGQSEISFNQRQFVLDIVKGLRGQYFEAEESAVKEFSNHYGEVRLPGQLPGSRTTGEVKLSDYQLLTDGQLLLAQPLVDKILRTDDVFAIKEDAIDYLQGVTASTLPEDDKLQLIAIGASILAFCDFIENGGIEEIRTILAKELEYSGAANGRVMGCEVSTRSVLAGGVTGFFGGLAWGCYSGAIAGTVVFPLVGTVAGCVNAGMVSAAGGFITGVTYSIASELLTTCFRNSGNTNE